MPKPEKIIIITGTVNSGKSTLAQTLLHQWKERGKTVGGIKSTSEIDANSHRKIAYYIQDIRGGDANRLATSTPKNGFFKFRRFYFNPEAFRFAHEIFLDAMDSDYIIVDEIGYLELEKKGFYESVVDLLKMYSGTLILVIRENLLDEILNLLNLRREDVEIKYTEKR
jgi:nucleoside-triphosphatase THEP1